MRQRVRRNASRENGFSATVSARALNVAAFNSWRGWFTCCARVNDQYCGRRVAVLYAAGELFACRSCYNLAYESQQGSPVLRSLSRSLKIRVRLGGSPNPFGPFPEKPCGMHWRTYLRLRAKGKLLAEIDRTRFLPTRRFSRNGGSMDAQMV